MDFPQATVGLRYCANAVTKIRFSYKNTLSIPEGLLYIQVTMELFIKF